jgi:hypothetical protein
MLTVFSNATRHFSTFQLASWALAGQNQALTSDTVACLGQEVAHGSIAHDVDLLQTLGVQAKLPQTSFEKLDLAWKAALQQNAVLMARTLRLQHQDECCVGSSADQQPKGSTGGNDDGAAVTTGVAHSSVHVVGRKAEKGSPACKAAALSPSAVGGKQDTTAKQSQEGSDHPIAAFRPASAQKPDTAPADRTDERIRTAVLEAQQWQQAETAGLRERVMKLQTQLKSARERLKDAKDEAVDAQKAAKASAAAQETAQAAQMTAEEQLQAAEVRFMPCC